MMDKECKVAFFPKPLLCHTNAKKNLSEMLTSSLIKQFTDYSDMRKNQKTLDDRLATIVKSIIIPILTKTSYMYRSGSSSFIGPGHSVVEFLWSGDFLCPFTYTGCFLSENRQ